MAALVPVNLGTFPVAPQGTGLAGGGHAVGEASEDETPVGGHTRLKPEGGNHTHHVVYELPIKAGGIAAATPVVTFFFFDIALKIELPKGAAANWFLNDWVYYPLYDIFL